MFMENLHRHTSLHIAVPVMYNLTSVLTLSVDALQNGARNTRPQSITVHRPKANVSTASQLHVPASYTLSIPDTQRF
jgi:hypothetical protein